MNAGFEIYFKSELESSCGKVPVLQVLRLNSLPAPLSKPGWEYVCNPGAHPGMGSSRHGRILRAVQPASLACINEAEAAGETLCLKIGWRALSMCHGIYTPAYIHTYTIVLGD